MPVILQKDTLTVMVRVFFYKVLALIFTLLLRGNEQQDNHTASRDQQHHKQQTDVRIIASLRIVRVRR